MKKNPQELFQLACGALERARRNGIGFAGVVADDLLARIERLAHG
ncbi:MAG: hypothetical protein ACREVG_17090 [Burkholderiales bacterium]